MSETLRARMREQLERELIERARARLASRAPAEGAAPHAAEATATHGDDLENDVLRLAAAALRMPEDRIDPDENLANYGVDSIAITEIMSGISRFFGVSIAPTTFFEARHLRDLAQILRARYGAAITAHYAAKAEAARSELASSESPRDRTREVAAWLARHRAARANERAAVTAVPEPISPAAPAVAPAKSLAEPIAIIGMEGMFPKSPDLDALEANLAAGRDCIEEIPAGRWDWRAVYGDPTRGPFSDVRYGGFVPGHDLFDAAFFNISPKEAELMDPQHRLFIECVWKLIEGAGLAPGSLAGRKVSLFLGINLQDYADLANRTGAHDPGQLTGLGHIFCANRLSFLLDINGPSQVIDTACSSSLVALHRAVQSIRHEGCEMAIAGGANLMLTPTQHILFARVGMLARDGRCKTFSRAANGYARAEGIGALLLKRLDLAQRDGDHILGVIRSSAENHGGAASSLTAPNPRAQAHLIAEAHKQAGIDPRTISYMECHGTGTPLGDPVEIEGLKAAFAELRDEPSAPYCGLGSVKSNIGHTETAAGIAGVIKVILGLRAGKLWQSLHCEEPNPLIDLRGSPFYLLDAPRDWERPIVDGREAPRRAGVSSFGAGGANAHVVIEEYRSVEVQQQDDGGPHLIPLSARNDTALREAAARLASHLASEAGTAQSLADIAHTLQSGRDAMRVRFACEVRDKSELRTLLEAFAQGGSHGVCTGTVERKGRGASHPGDTSDLAAVSAHWVSGGAVDWAMLHQGRRLARVTLPTYPFQRKRFWLPETTKVPVESQRPAAESALALDEISPSHFRVRLHPDAFFLRDHVVGDAPTLPGVAYLELMRLALERAGLHGSLGQVVWLRPLIVTEPLDIEIAVLREAEPQPRVEVVRVDDDGTRHPHAQARVVPKTDDAPARGDIAALEAAHTSRHSAAEIYAVFDAMGIAYGPAHRAVVSLACGVDAAGQTQVFGRLNLPVSTPKDGFVLHPSLMDGAFQCALGMALNEAGESAEGAALPFALDRVEILGPCVAEMAVLIRVSAKGEQAGRVRTLDLDLMDMSGVVRVRMQGFATRKLAKPASESLGETLLFAPEWRPLVLEAATAPAQFARRHVVLCDRSQQFADHLRAEQPGWSFHVSQGEGGAAAGFSAHAQALLALIQQAAGEPGSGLLQVVVPTNSELLTGLSGLLRTARQEVPRLHCQLIALDAEPDPAELARRLETYARRSDLDCIRDQGEITFAHRWRKLEPDSAARRIPWRNGGIYLITGGSGGLGRLFAREIASHARDSILTLASRTPGDVERDAELAAACGANGARIEHAVLDVADADATSALIAGIRARLGRLDGVLHAAGLFDDGAITGKTPESLAAILAPKVTGVCNLDRAIGNEPLDLFLLFASISGALGNPGQADYAAANAFLDVFAKEREARRRAGLCQGRTLSVDWLLWRDGGMRMSPDAERLMTRTTGLAVLESAAAFEALYQALGTDEPQVLVVTGDRARIEARLLEEKTPAPATTQTAASIDASELERKILSSLCDLVSAQLKVSVADLVPDAELSEYGFDSISFTQFANTLNDCFGLALTPTIFFEHPTLGELAAHFSRDHTTAFSSALGVLPRAPVIEIADVSVPSAPTPVRAAHTPTSVPVAAPMARSPIAIIGMSGAFPDAPNPEALWRNLLNGHDAIRDAPSGRWDRAPRGDVQARGGFIDGIGEFDAAFFGLSAPEARTIDPQQRLLLTHTWRLLEDAGYAPRKLWGANVGVFIGIADTGYGRLVGQAGGPTEGYAMTGLAPSVGPNRVSFHFNFTGPSVAVETACSSALVAIHRAAEAIHSGDCTAAIAGGVNLLLSPETFEGFVNAGMLARDGRSKTFSANADGYGRGEGIGLVFLKRLDEAERDGDRILAVIRGSAENHGGRANSLTAPNPKAQAALLKRAYERAGFDPRTVSYIETHGTGTPLGDPIEVEALSTAFAELSADAETRFGTRPPMACGIGSIKSNIGHLELAAGAAGLIKVLLQMRHGMLARSLHCEILNPYLKLEDSPFHVVRENAPWVRPRDADGRELPRRAGVSAFGFGGSNAHLALEEYISPDAPEPTHRPSGPVAIILSARSEEQLLESARQLYDALADRSDAELAGIAFTLQTCRDPMEHRLAFLAASIGEVRWRLAAFVASETESEVQTGRVKSHRDMMALLESDADVRHALSGLGDRGRLDILLGLWLRGLPFDWRTLYGAHAPPRAELPGYPFARTVYWVRPVQDERNHGQTRGAAPPMRAAAIASPAQNKTALEASAPKGAEIDEKDAVNRALDRLAEIAARLLETETSVLDPDTELGEFGFDSISMTTFATKVNDELGLSLTPADFFEFATLARLARHVAGGMPRPTDLDTHAEGADAATVPVVAGPDFAPQRAPNDDPIAIVGMSCAFPGAPDANAFWNNLISGQSSISEIPADRWDWREFHGDPKSERNKTNVRFGGFIDGVFEFDPLFFGISPREAALMDPQQRLMMTHAWKALEDAGHAPRSLAGQPVGLFVGTSSSGFCDLLDEDTGAEGYAATGSVPSVGPNRISYLLDWHGPSEPVETACSSSLVALHRAVQAMRAGDCDVAVVGGVNTIVTPEAHINFAKAGMLSLDGACKTFSSNANGYARGEGVGMLVLKRLSQAERDGDAIYAVVRGSAINHGGRANSFTAPNTSAQADVVTRAYAQAGIDPATVGYIEAHGTGTSLGDPVEINALKSAFASVSDSSKSEGIISPGCGLGSAKTNIGHLELAAGVVGVIKVLLQLRHRTLAPSLNSEPPNPYIDFRGSPFFVVRESQPWKAAHDASGQELPRRAGVSSFGFGGVNAHVVLEEYVDRRIASPQPASVVVPLSARDEARLADQARQLLDHLDREENLSLADVAFTLQAGRTPLKHRLAFVARSLEELRTDLGRFLAGDQKAGYRGVVGHAAVSSSVADPTPEAAAARWVHGGEVDWKHLDPAPRRRLHLPTYPFAREEYRAGRMPRGTSAAAPTAQPHKHTTLSLDQTAFYLRDHRIAGAPILPGAMTLELARAASGRSAPLSLRDIVWLKPVGAAAGALVRVALDSGAFRLLTGESSAEVSHAQGRLGDAPEPAPIIDLAAIRARCERSRSPAWLYDTFASLGMDYGPAFRSVTQLGCGHDEVLARLDLPTEARNSVHEFFLHPSMIDGALQACLALYDQADGGSTAVPFALERVEIFAPTTREMWAHVRARSAAGSVRKIDIDLADDAGAVIVRLIGFSVRMLPGKATPRPSGETARDAAARYFTALIAAETGVPVGQIELAASLDTYGIDSVMIVRLTDELEKKFGSLPKTLFFEHRTLDAVLTYFLEHHAERLHALTGERSASPPALAAVSPKPEPRREAELHTPIAIVGLAGRYPGARDLETFWNNLAAGRDCITELPLDRWDHGRFSKLERGSGAKWGGFVEGVAEFDPLFFNISPREAPYMDPQERLFLQCAYEAIEDSGYTRAALAEGDVGVFVGVMWEEYQLYGAERTAQGEPLALSSSPASIANRVSSVCDFRGPSMAVDSMCSSSLSAIHLACESLSLGTCTAAIAGGVNLSLHPNKYLALTQGRFLSSSGRCESFGAGGDGYVPGEGVGAVVLKRLDRAVADGDQIYGVIRGSALNHGGKTNGYTVPNPQAQTAVIRRALEKAGVEPRQVSYVEAHGTGTKLGDPIEVTALSNAYRAETPDTGFCAIGSVKSNIGHCESAASIAGLTKVLLQMRHHRLAPSLHSGTLNPGIDFTASPFTVQRRLDEWRRPRLDSGDGPRIAGLSSFGAGGSNAHLIVEEYDAASSAATASQAGPFVFPFSARDAAALDRVVQRFLVALETMDVTDLAAASHVLQTGREAFEVRLAVVAANILELGERLRASLDGDTEHAFRGVRRPGEGELSSTTMEARDLDAIARAWCSGAHVEWQRLWRGSPPRRISLPTYPFARDTYWVPGLEIGQAPASQPVAAPASVLEARAAASAPLPLLFTPDWQPRAAKRERNPEARRLVVCCELPGPMRNGRSPAVEIHELKAPGASLEQRFGHYTERILSLIQSLMKERPDGALLQVVVPREGGDVTLEGLGGLLRTAMQERPGLRCQLISVDAASSRDMAERLDGEARSGDTDIRYEVGQRLVRQWRQCRPERVPGPWKDGGVYLVTGGLGGLGLLLAEHLAGSVHQPTLWLTGRSAPSSAVLARLAKLNATVVHRHLDVTDGAAAAKLIREIEETSGRLDGIVHAAGITRDKLLLRKSSDELREVLAPKVAGLMALDAASAGCDLDFMLLFASVSGALGNPGQSDYAVANAFMDAFAERRNTLVSEGRRRGMTLSIDWPYWRDGGMSLSEGVITAMKRATGVTPLETPPAFAALDAAVAIARAENLSQILVLDGDHPRLRGALLGEGDASENPQPQPNLSTPAPASINMEAVTAYLASEIAAVLKVPADKLDANETFDRYGLDSVSALEVIDRLEAKLGAIPKTLLFEYPTVAKLAVVLMETHALALRTDLREPQPGSNAAEESRAAIVAAPETSPARASDTDIAIIAVAGRYPGADTPEALWEALREGRDLITEVPPDRWDIDTVFAPGKGHTGKSYCRWGGFISNVHTFDAAFFGISPREAARMDPQERLFLETAWHVLDRGGYPRGRLQRDCASKVGVFVGAMSQQYRAFAAGSHGDRSLLTLTSHASLANRVSYYFDLQGPSVAVDSMCSSGLEAVHLACQSLRRRECKLAIAGAVNLSIHPDKYIGLSEAGLVGSHAGSRAFAGGDGYLPAEGVGAVLLKPLADALAARDVILGVIKGTNVNHSGRSAGYGVPSAEAQQRLIEDNFSEAGIDPRTIGYVEAAATGSALGDAMEMRAMTRAFRSFTADESFCAVGSVKANIGHAEAASGLAQLTKCLFQLQHRMLAPRSSDISTDLDVEFTGTPFRLQTELAPWRRMEPDQPLRASISSFGAGGTNVHLILEEAPSVVASISESAASAPSAPLPFVFSAGSEEQLAALMADIARYVDSEPDLSLRRLSWTLRTCRERLACTAEIVAADRQELLRKLSAWPGGQDEHGPALSRLAVDEEAGPPLILPDYPFSRTRHWLSGSDIVAASAGPSRAHAETGEPRTARELICSLLAEETGLDPLAIPATKAFRDLGAASIFSLRLIRAVADEFEVEITHGDLEVHENVDALAALIGERRRGAEPRASISPATADGDLSEGQLGLWLLQKLYPDMSTYNVPLAFRIADPDAEALERALAVILERFPILARRIVDNAGTPRASTDASTVVITALSISEGADETEFLRERAARPFDLSAGPPIRCEIITRTGKPGSALVLIVAHHIAIDGLSATILARTLWDAYACFAEGRALPPSSPPTGFSEFVGFERALLASEKGKAHLAYWRNRLAGDLPALDLSADRIADPSQPITSASIERRLAPDLAQAVHAATRTLRVNRPAFFLAVMNVLLHRYTGTDDLLIGMPLMGRPARRFEESVGCFANMIVTRASVKSLASAAELIAAVQSDLTEALDNADVPYAALVRELGRSSIDGPLYQVSFAYQNFFDRRPLAAGAEHIEGIRQQGGDVLGIEMFEDGDTLRIVANYDAARFDAARVERMLDHFTNLATAIAAAPDTPVSALGMLSGSERDLILGPWATGGAMPTLAGTVPEWIVAQAERAPAAVALIVGAERLTYRELTRQALALADHLAARGVGAGDRVAVLLERGAPALVAMLGVLSAAAVYVPLDTGQPEARLAACLADAEVRAVIVDEANEARLSELGVTIPETIQIDREADTIRAREVRWPRPVDRANAAYIIYTSGSTGVPKGVVVSHAALADHCRVMIDHYGLGASDRVLQFSALNVDPSLEQSLTALISGASVVMRRDEVWTPAELRKVIERECVTVADLPPAYLAEVFAAWENSSHAPKNVPRLWICGGEALSSETVRLWRNGPQTQSRLINAYGPTEATVTALTHEVAPVDLDAVPIGRPLPGTFVYVLDDNGQPVPEGVPGELYIGGSRLAIGYLGREDLTRERFLPNPFGDGRLYRTGDRVAFIPGTEGSLAFLGRVDTQIKIRGFRVELGEVEAALAASGARQAAVIFLAGALIAFVAEDEASFDAEAIAAAMAGRLPGYMCPASYVRVDALPLTHAGKIDRTQLKTRALQPSGTSDGSHAEATTEPEQKMIGLWQEVFGESLQTLSLGPDSDFFALGGHSLLAVRLLSSIERAYGQSLSMTDLISAPTVADQVRRLATREAAESRSGMMPKLVELRQGAGSPLFLLPPVGGSVSCYIRLARTLDIDRPIYGVEAPDEGTDIEDVDLPQRAAAFLAALRRVQPKGPYQLGGWSLGGVLAYEMACQLLAAGEEVAPLILIDAYAPARLAELGGSGGKSTSDALAVFARDLMGIFGSEPLRRDDGEIVNSIADLYRVPELEPALDGVDPMRLARRFAIFSANLRMAETYRPEPCALAATLYVATDGHADRTRGWSSLVQGGLGFEDLPGDHYALLTEPLVEHLARFLERDIGRLPNGR